MRNLIQFGIRNSECGIKCVGEADNIKIII